jgi:hypothetical protein
MTCSIYTMNHVTAFYIRTAYIRLLSTSFKILMSGKVHSKLLTLPHILCSGDKCFLIRTCLFRLSYTQYGRCAPPPTIAALQLYSLHTTYISPGEISDKYCRENPRKIPVWGKILELVSQRPTESIRPLLF